MNYYLITNILLSFIVGVLVIYMLKYNWFKRFCKIVHPIYATIVFSLQIFLIVTVGAFCIVIDSLLFIIQAVIVIIAIIAIFTILFVNLLIKSFNAIMNILNKYIKKLK